MNILKETFKSVYLPVHFFYSMTLSPDVQKIVKEKKLNVKLLSLILHRKQMMTKTLKLKLLIVFPCLLMNFMIFHKILLKIVVDKYVVNFNNWWRNQTLNILPGVNSLLICGGSMEKKNSQHLIFTLQLLTK